MLGGAVVECGAFLLQIPKYSNWLAIAIGFKGFRWPSDWWKWKSQRSIRRFVIHHEPQPPFHLVYTKTSTTISPANFLFLKPINFFQPWNSLISLEWIFWHLRPQDANQLYSGDSGWLQQLFGAHWDLEASKQTNQPTNKRTSKQQNNQRKYK